MIDFDKLVDQHIARELKPKQIGRYYPSEVGSLSEKTMVFLQTSARDRFKPVKNI